MLRTKSERERETEREERERRREREEREDISSLKKEILFKREKTSKEDLKKFLEREIK